MSSKSTDAENFDMGTHTKGRIRIKYIGEEYLLQVRDRNLDQWNSLPDLLDIDDMYDLSSIILIETR